MEHWGSGVTRIIEKVKAAGLRLPEFIGGKVDLLSIFIEIRLMIRLTLMTITLPLNRRESADEVPDNTNKMPDNGQE